MSADEARRRDAGVFRGLLILAPVVAAAWAPLIALLYSRAT